MDSRRFAVALSFPGEKRDFVSRIAEALAAKLGKEKILYDKYHEAEFARPNLDVHLPNLYQKESELIAIFLCDDYKKKRWCNLEWRSIRQLIATADEDRIMFLSFDNIGAIPEIGIYDGDGYLAIGDRSPVQIAELILSRYKPAKINEAQSPTARYDISRIIKYAPAELIGREDELKILSDAWQQAVNGEGKRPHILTFVALGGEGKTSLVAKWAAQLAHEDWPGCESAFAWSFYSQGTSEKTQASSDSFLKEALLFFGDVEMANSAAGSFDKGRRLAQLIGERRALLILDGVEPLQYAPTSPVGSELKDQGVSALLKALATKNVGLCIVTTRYSIPDLRNFWQTTAAEIPLSSLSIDAGVALLRKLGVKGAQQEFDQLVNDVRGHALTLNLLGSYLSDAQGGDIRKRDLVKLEAADAEEQCGHAFHVMDAYVISFKSEGEKGTRALSVLRLLGLFDRPATVDCLNALWTSEEIGGLNEPLIGISEAQRNITLKRLEDANLITVNREKGSGALVSLDAHPLLREYFAKRVSDELPGAWRAAHHRLYEYLRDNTNEGDEPTLEDLQPLYQAVAHGCQAGMIVDAYNDIYVRRIEKGDAHYSVKKIGAFASELGALVWFFEKPWTHPAPVFSEFRKATLLHGVAFRLRALGRLREALEPFVASTQWAANNEHWKHAATGGRSLNELQLMLGDISAALIDSKIFLTYGERSDEPFQSLSTISARANVLNYAGYPGESATLFAKAEHLQSQLQPNYELLYSLRGFNYCELLTAAAERIAWDEKGVAMIGADKTESIKVCANVMRRAIQMLTWAEETETSLLDRALIHLTLGRVALYVSILQLSPFENNDINAAVDGFRVAGTTHHMPRALLTRAWLRFLECYIDGAREDLDEAWGIAERGPMRLHMADIHLYRARLFHAVKPYPWNKFPDGTEGRGPKDDLRDARKLIEQCGYWRRKEELEDAEEAAKNW